MNLFQLGPKKLHSGEMADFKIDCDALTDEDLECLTRIIVKQVKFRQVFGIPTGGLRLAARLSKYTCADLEAPVLIVDDVLTTGNSMEEMRRQVGEPNVEGFVIFSRKENLPDWIQALFTMK